MEPLAIDLFAGLFGWGESFAAEGYQVVGFDLERRGPIPKGCELVLQDVLTLHGAQFREAVIIVASPPCQNYSYMAMPWKRAKQMAVDIQSDPAHIVKLNALFDACFRIQREACEAAGRYIPLVVENVKGAQKWVGKAKAHFGSFYLWGDVESIGNAIVRSGCSMNAGRLPGPRMAAIGLDLARTPHFSVGNHRKALSARWPRLRLPKSLLTWRVTLRRRSSLCARIVRMKDFGSAFSAAEDQYIQDHYLESTSAAMAIRLKRSLASTQNRIRHLGLKKKPHVQGKLAQKKLSVFLELDLVARIDDRRGKLSVSGYIQELVRRGLPRKGKAA